MKTQIRIAAVSLILVVSIGCGGGGGGSDGGSDPKHCTSEGYPLYCSATNSCCPPGHPYVCRFSCKTITGPCTASPYCSAQPCGINTDVLDYCGEE